MKAAGQFKMLASAMFAVIGLVTAVVLSGCGGDNGTGPNPDNPGGGKGNDISNYRTVKIGTQTWMAENLNNAVSGSVCYGQGGKVIIDWNDDGEPITKTLSAAEVQANCAQYGRLYTFADAKTACPSGWHLPSDAEWTTLVDFVGGGDIAGTKLKSSTGWESYGGVPKGTDQYGFSALPGGDGSSDGRFSDAGGNGNWWSATEGDASYAWGRRMGCNYESVGRFNYGKAYLFSVRCVAD